MEVKMFPALRLPTKYPEIGKRPRYIYGVCRFLPHWPGSAASTPAHGVDAVQKARTAGMTDQHLLELVRAHQITRR
ncbi:hypothetical protein ACX80Z_02795 [Arthrobacter sp. TMT4-20]